MRYAGAADMTLQDVSNVYNQVVREMSLNLVLHEAALQQAAAAAGGAAQWPPADLTPWLNIRTAFERWAAQETLCIALAALGWVLGET
jgi:hypothetical protein